MKKNTLKTVLAIALSGLALSANAASYTFTDLGSLGGSSSSAYAINNVGQVVGYSAYQYHAIAWNGNIITDLGGNYAVAINNAGQVAGITYFGGNVYGNHTIATVWNGTSATYLGKSGADNTYAFAINDVGQVAGYAITNSNSDSRATIWNGTTATDLGSGSAYAINNSGQIAGNSGAHATVWNGTTATDLGTLLGGNSSGASAINDAGQIAGWSTNASNEVRATLWNGTTASDLGTLGGNSYALDINTTGLVVGVSYIPTPGDGRRATLWNGTAVTDLNSFLDASSVAAGWILMDAASINDNGWIVGTASNSLLGISGHGYMLAPVPEPDNYAMMLMGVGLMGFVARRRSKHQI